LAIGLLNQLEIYNMRATQFITEAATDIVYHYMNTYDAIRTLRDNHYSLESSTGLDVEEKMMPKNKHWYLATTRSKVGDYHIQKAGTSGAIFVLNGRWLNQNYETRPVDYWSPVWNYKSFLKKGVWSKEISASSKRSMWQDKPYSGSEAEDRVFSDTHAIPLRGSTLEIHVFVISTVHKPFSDTTKKSLQLSTYYDKESLGARAAEVREILRWGQKRDIPVYLYDNKQDWITQRPNNRIDPNSEYGRKLLSGKPAKSYIRTPYVSDYYNNAPYWIELIEKNPATDKLSEPADKLRYNILYYWDTFKSFQTNVMGNAARNPESPDYPGVIEINKFLSQKRLPDIKSLQEFLKRKWSSYKH